MDFDTCNLADQFVMAVLMLHVCCWMFDLLWFVRR
jgi:hypothetical protein